jgi:hypothetical protein
MVKEEFKKDILPPPPIGKSIGHGILDSKRGQNSINREEDLMFD